MRIKSIDINFVKSIFYLANKYVFDISLFSLKFNKLVKLLQNVEYFCFLLKLKEPASIPPASS